MAKKTEQEETFQEEKTSTTPLTKTVVNRSGQRIELLVDDAIVVFLPKEEKELPLHVDIPKGIGLIEK